MRDAILRYLTEYGKEILEGLIVLIIGVWTKTIQFPERASDDYESL